jgi:Flp pilus assembly protein TadD
MLALPDSARIAVRNHFETWMGRRSQAKFTMATFASTEDGDQCAICLEPIADPYELDCLHTFCRGCINAYKERGVNDVCPYCRAPLPPGAELSVDECHKMTARIGRYKAAGDEKRAAISKRLLLHHAQRAVKADPMHETARFYLAKGLEATKDFEGAVREYRETIQINSGNAGTHCNLGFLLTRLQDYDGAEREYREAVRCDPNDADAHTNLGKLKDVRKDYDGAEREYREAIRLDPNKPQTHNNLGKLLHTTRKDFDGAEREFHEAIRCDPNNAPAHFNLGCVIMVSRGDCDGAAREFREALRIDPHHAYAREYLQKVLEEKAAAGELRVGADVVLVGLASAKFNGARGTVVSGCKNGRWGVKLQEHDGKVMAIKTENIGPHGGN